MSESASASAYGQEVAELLQARLADMYAADTLAELVAGNPRSDPASPGDYILDVGATAGLRFRAVPPVRSDAERISRVLITQLEFTDAGST